MEALKKITISSINNKRGGFTVKEGDPDKVVGRIFGRADKVDSKETNYGPYLRFTGAFSAINEEREESRAPVLILPSPADSLLKEALLKDSTGMGVTFAFDVVLRAKKKRDEADRGYEYIVKPLMETSADDPLKAIAAALPPMAPKAALPAPTQDAAAAAPTTDAAQASDAASAPAPKKGK